MCVQRRSRRSTPEIVSLEGLLLMRKSGLLTMWNDAPLSIVRLRTRPGAMLYLPIGPVVRSERGAGNCGSSAEEFSRLSP